MIYYLKLALVRPKEIYKARHIKKGPVIGIIALLILFITLINMVRLFPIINDVQSDGQEIASELPGFTVSDGQLQAESADSYIHQTNTFLFFFDPNNQTENEEIDENLERLNVPIGIGIFPENLYLNLSGFTMETPYTQLDNFDDETVKEIFNGAGDLSLVSYLISFLVLYIGLGIFEIFDLIFILLFANLLSRLLKSRLLFTENLKIAVLAALLPTIAVEVASLLNVLPAYTFELKIGLSLFLFYLTIREMKKTDVKS